MIFSAFVPFLKYIHHFKSSKVMFSRISDHFVKTWGHENLSLSSSDLDFLCLVYSTLPIKYQLILIESYLIFAMTQLNLIQASLCSRAFSSVRVLFVACPENSTNCEDYRLLDFTSSVLYGRNNKRQCNAITTVKLDIHVYVAATSNV